MCIARVFPRQTRATPRDDYAFIGEPPSFFLPNDISEVHISVTFSWDLPRAEQLEKLWRKVAPVRIGGPAMGEKGGDFVPGRYLKHGYVITSRGCPNRCWFCSVPIREGGLRELPITEGWNVLDDNLLACSDAHIIEVFRMLERVKREQRKQIKFTGGLEAKRLKSWHIEWFKRLRPSEMFFAYDTSDDLYYLEEASRLFRDGGYGSRHNTYCYVLCGYSGDTFSAAEARCRSVMKLGITPYAMVYRDNNGIRSSEWTRFQRSWVRPACIWGTRHESKNIEMPRGVRKIDCIG